MGPRPKVTNVNIKGQITPSQGQQKGHVIGRWALINVKLLHS